VAVAIGSVALVADSVDFLEDAALNLLIVAGLGWSPGSSRMPAIAAPSRARAAGRQPRPATISRLSA
jgi:hypothetical protein